LADFTEELVVLAGILDMRLDLFATSTGMPRPTASMGAMKRLLEWDDSVGETFEYLLRVQAEPGISNADYVEASHLLHRVSIQRSSLVERVEREKIHIESDPDCLHPRRGDHG
jgi:hypothetical protein